MLSRCFWPPESEIPWEKAVNKSCDSWKIRTLSPTSVMSPLGSISISGSKHASRTAFQYLSGSKERPKQIFYLIVAFYIDIESVIHCKRNQHPLGSMHSVDNTQPSHQTWCSHLSSSFRLLNLVISSSFRYPQDQRQPPTSPSEFPNWCPWPEIHDLPLPLVWLSHQSSRWQKL